jgi:PAS domain S-box-containing protein
MKTAAAAPQAQDFVISRLSPSPAQKRLALAVVLALLVAFVITAGPLSTIQLVRIDAFVPAYATAMFVNDLITAVLLFAQFSILRSRGLLLIASGYLFTALVVIAWMLTFPGVFAPSGLLGAGPQSTNWLYILWHVGFPMFVIAYALLKDADPATRLWQGSAGAAILSSVAMTAAVVCVATFLVTAYDPLLPRLMLDTTRVSAFWYYAAGSMTLMSVLALIVLWVRRRSVLDLWLMVVMCAYVVEISFPRFSVGWYAGRVFGLLSSSLVLFVLLYEITLLYRQRAEDRLREQARLLDLTHDIVFVRDMGDVISYWNRAAEELYGWTRKEALDKVSHQLMQTIFPAPLVDINAELLRSERWEGELTHTKRDGTHVVVASRWSLQRDKKGRPVAILETHNDITERKCAEAERARLEERLRHAEKMEAVGRLAGGIAHDFNNVLAGILAYGEMLFEEAPADSPRKRHAQNVLAAAARGRSLVEQILAYSRSQRGKRVPTDICRSVAETLELVRGSLPADIRLDANIPALSLVVIGDATQLHQVVMNLCSNAIQALSGGGALRVALEAAEMETERALSHGTLKPGRYVRLSVEDSGCGMDEPTLSRIFEPFFTTKEIGRGTGLGLSLVDAIVTDLPGAIDVKSAVTQGSTFAVYLPLAEVVLATAARTERPPPPGSGVPSTIVG